MVEVEILGHKATVGHIAGQTKLEPWHKEDHLEVWLSFDPPVGSTISFVVDLPAKKYADREEFLYNVRRRGEEALKQILAKDEERSRERQERKERQKELDAVAAEAQKLIE